MPNPAPFYGVHMNRALAKGKPSPRRGGGGGLASTNLEYDYTATFSGHICPPLSRFLCGPNLLHPPPPLICTKKNFHGSSLSIMLWVDRGQNTRRRVTFIRYVRTYCNYRAYAHLFAARLAIYVCVLPLVLHALLSNSAFRAHCFQLLYGIFLSMQWLASGRKCKVHAGKIADI